MKRFLKIALVVVLCIASLFPMKSFAIDGEKVQWYNIDFPESEIQRILGLNPQDEASTRASDLIVSYNVGIAKDGSTIKLVAKMVCDGDVVKCGFKKILIQKRATTSSSWSTCLTLEDLYYNGYAHSIGRIISVPYGLVTQKIELASNIVTI